MLRADKISKQLELVELNLSQRIGCIKILLRHELRQDLFKQYCKDLTKWANTFNGAEND